MLEVIGVSKDATFRVDVGRIFLRSSNPTSSPSRWPTNKWVAVGRGLVGVHPRRRQRFLLQEWPARVTEKEGRREGSRSPVKSTNCIELRFRKSSTRPMEPRCLPHAILIPSIRPALALLITARFPAIAEIPSRVCPSFIRPSAEFSGSKPKDVQPSVSVSSIAARITRRAISGKPISNRKFQNRDVQKINLGEFCDCSKLGQKATPGVRTASIQAEA